MICKSALKRLAGYHPVNSPTQNDGALFRPLYQDLTGAGAGSESREGHASSDFKVETAREKAFQEGQERGRAEARAQLRASLSPGLTFFLQRFTDLTHMEETVRLQMNAQVTELAGAVADRILGEPADIDGQHVQHFLRNRISESSGFCLNIHLNDLASLKKVLIEAGHAWTPRMELLFKTNPAVQPGEIRLEDHSTRPPT
jgi:flagellar biosynthesis/type III secretory pathway protein FliH